MKSNPSVTRWVTYSFVFVNKKTKQMKEKCQKCLHVNKITFWFVWGFFGCQRYTNISFVFFCLFFCGINTFASRLHDEDRKLWVPTDTPRVENHCLRLAEGNAEVPPTELHVNKHKLGMRRLSNGGLSFPLGLNDA